MFRYTNVLLDQCSVDESASDENVVDESTPTRFIDNIELQGECNKPHAEYEYSTTCWYKYLQTLYKS